MPRKNGTGPAGQGSRTGRGRQQGGRGQGQRGGYRLGPGGTCVCPNCGEKRAHRQGVACFDMQCPKCGTPMTRE